VKYTVRIFPIVRVTFPGIEANSQEEAMKKAEEQADFDNFFSHGGEYADDIDGFLVDEESDPNHYRSRWYDKHMKPV
jgi:hypothetical protein